MVATPTMALPGFPETSGTSLIDIRLTGPGDLAHVEVDGTCVVLILMIHSARQGSFSKSPVVAPSGSGKNGPEYFELCSGMDQLSPIVSKATLTGALRLTSTCAPSHTGLRESNGYISSGNLDHELLKSTSHRS